MFENAADDRGPVWNAISQTGSCVPYYTGPVVGDCVRGDPYLQSWASAASVVSDFVYVADYNILIQ